MSAIRTDKKFIYIHIPRTAGNSIASIDFVKINGSEKISFYKQQLEYGIIPGKTFDDFFKFTFVRNPYDRLVSAYFYFFPEKTKDDFNNFVLNELNLKELLFQPQYTFLCDENKNLLVDFVGKFENLDADWRKICNRVGAEYQELPILKPSEHDDYTTYYNEELRQFVKEVYKDDFELFNYE